MNWRKDSDLLPGRFYRSTDGRYEIRWDPAGRTEDEQGGWYLSLNEQHLGIFPTLSAAKQAAEEER